MPNPHTVVQGWFNPYVQAGVMTVMAVAETAKFNIARLNRRVF